MKPLNLDNKPCSPISSNCVVWQGPDIPCINLCTGDTVSDVVSAMATELCTILDTLKVSNYDLTCFNLQACGPEDFQALIQFLITKICELEGVTPETKDEPTCPDCVVSVAECFVTGTQTTMQLVDYVQLIGERVCSIVTEISLINTQITDILIRLTDLENAATPTFTTPTIDVTCASFPLSGIQAIDDVLAEFINNVWCGFYAVTGTATELTNAIDLNKCVDETTPTLTNPAANYGSISGWVATADYDTVADSISNMWILLCDVFTYLGAVPTLEVQDDGVIIETDTSVINFKGDGVTVTSTGASTIEVAVPGAPETKVLELQAQPIGFSRVVPGLNSSRLCDGQVQISTALGGTVNTVYNDGGYTVGSGAGNDFNTDNGVFTVPETGIYTISFFFHFTRDTGTGWFDAGTPGQVTAGIVSSSACNFFVVNNFTPVVISKHASINGSFTRELTAGTEFRLNVINTLAYDYVTVSGDTARLTIHKHK